MLKYVLMASAVTLAVPATAQVTTPPQQDAATPTQDNAVPPADTSTAPADTAATAATPARGDQVAAIVDREFATYDKDGSGTLNKAEFAAWMNALKAQAPAGAAAKPDAAWNETAFAQADSDKSKSV